MMMWRIARASVLLGSGGARPACQTRQAAAPSRNHPAWANRSDRPVSAGRGDSGVIAARDDGGARALTAPASEVLFRRATTRYEIKMLGYSFQACHGLLHQANPPVRMTTMAPRAAAGPDLRAGASHLKDQPGGRQMPASDHAWPMERIANRLARRKTVEEGIWSSRSARPGSVAPSA